MVPEISVIVPVYNVEKELKRCVDSVLSQTFSNYELILVNDGSPDNAAEICDEYSKQDQRVRVIHQENQGVSVARNNGILNSRGEYIIFIDSDDFVDPTYLERLYQACLDNQAEISVMPFEGVSNERLIAPRYKGVSRIMTNCEAIEAFGTICGPNFRSAVSKLVKKSIVEKYLFPQGRKWGEDTACVYKWYWEANRIAEIDGNLYFYINNHESVSNQKFSRLFLGELDTFEEVLLFCDEKDLGVLQKSMIGRYLNTAWEDYYKAIAVNDKNLAKDIQLRMRRMIKRYGKKYSINIKSKTELFDVAYPFVTKNFRRWVRILHIIGLR